jgi:hypothetical protein
MPAPSSPYFALWAAAQAEALQAEHEVLKARLTEANGSGPPISENVISNAKQLRAKASALLLATVSESDRSAESIPVVSHAVAAKLLEQLRSAAVAKNAYSGDEPDGGHPPA